MNFIELIAAGAGVGFIVGLTGVGGGALMTPLLLLFGFPPSVAIGTDLLFAAFTKTSGMISHARMGHINWRIVRHLATGSIPAALVTGLALSHFAAGGFEYSGIFTSALGVMLMITAVVLIARKKIQAWTQSRIREGEGPDPYRIATLAGVVLGVFVTLSSVGAGAIGTALLMLLFPALAANKIVGSDIAHAVPLTFVAGGVHLFLGHVDFSLLLALLTGSVPAIHLGAKVSAWLPNKVMNPVLATMLLLLGMRYAFF